MDLIRDVLDNQLVDRHQRRIGKIDGIVIRIPESGPPKLAFIETGMVTKAQRIHPRLARWIGRWSSPFRISWRKVRDIGVDVEVDLDADETPLLDLENRLARALKKVPGA
jgi:hypothetical protein